MRIIAASSILLMIVWNYVGNSGVLYSQNISEVSADWTTLFTPAGFTFAIWGLIYLLLSIIALEFILNAKSGRELKGRTFNLIFIQSLLNALWIHCFISSWLWLSLLSLLLLCIVNFLIILENPGLKSWRNYAWSVYAGWTAVATVANASIVFVSIGVEAESELTYRFTCIGVALLAAFAAVKLKRYWIIFPVVWGLFGIAMRNYDIASMYYPAIMSSFFLLLFALNRMVKTLRFPEQS